LIVPPDLSACSAIPGCPVTESLKNPMDIPSCHGKSLAAPTLRSAVRSAFAKKLMNENALYPGGQPKPSALVVLLPGR